MSITVLVVDDHEVVRRGLVDLLEGPDIEVIGHAPDGEQGIERALALEPDVTVMDVRMPVMDGLTALEMLRRAKPDASVVMYSGYDNPTYVARAAALGARDYVLKSESRVRLKNAILHAASVDESAEEGLMSTIKKKMLSRDPPSSLGVRFTRREMQVLRHIGLGLSNRDIGLSLGISVETVKEHVQNVLRKLDVNDRTQAAVWAVRQGVV